MVVVAGGLDKETLLQKRIIQVLDVYHEKPWIRHHRGSFLLTKEGSEEPARFFRITQFVQLVIDEQEFVTVRSRPPLVREADPGNRERGDDVNIGLVGYVPDLGGSAHGETWCVVHPFTAASQRILVAAVKNECDLSSAVISIRTAVVHYIEIMLAGIRPAGNYDGIQWVQLEIQDKRIEPRGVEGIVVARRFFSSQPDSGDVGKTRFLVDVDVVCAVVTTAAEDCAGRDGLAWVHRRSHEVELIQLQDVNSGAVRLGREVRVARGAARPTRRVDSDVTPKVIEGAWSRQNSEVLRIFRIGNPHHRHAVAGTHQRIVLSVGRRPAPDVVEQDAPSRSQCADLRRQQLA